MKLLMIKKTIINNKKVYNKKIIKNKLLNKNNNLKNYKFTIINKKFNKMLLINNHNKMIINIMLMINIQQLYHKDKMRNKSKKRISISILLQYHLNNNKIYNNTILLTQFDSSDFF